MNLDTFYQSAPVWVQNLMVTAYGGKLYYERYLNRDHGFLQFLHANQKKSLDEIRQQQLDSLKELLRYAKTNVPYYRQRIDFAPDSVTSLEELRQLPLLKKETLRTQGEFLLAQGYRRKDLVAVNTSGTTGKSLRLYIDLASRRKCYAFFSRFHSWAGLSSSRNNVTFGGRTIVPQSQKGKEFWRYNAIMGNYLFSTYHLSEENLPCYVEKMRKVQPEWIESYPSAIYLVAKFMEEHGLSGIRPKAVITSGETLFEHQREVVERVFGCRLFDQYGCTEQALFVSQCEAGTYHVHPEFGIVELLDDDDRPVPEGKTGRVVCTSFINRAMPLIRYDLGDTAQMSATGCACGRDFPVIGRICGRMDDYIRTPDGKRVGRLDPIFKSVTSIKLAQIVQLNLHDIVVRLVPGSDYRDEDGEIIQSELRKRVGGEMNIALEVVSEIEKDGNAKFRAVVSHVR